MRNSKLWAPAFSQFEALRLHVPDEIDDRRIREYHDLLNQLQIASGEDLICFQIPQNEIHPKILSVTRVSRRFPSRTQFSKTKYCSKDFFSRLRLLSTILAVVVLTAAAAAQKLVSFPTEDGGEVKSSRLIFFARRTHS